MTLGARLRCGVAGQRATLDDQPQFAAVTAFAVFHRAGEGGYGAFVQPAAVGAKEAVFEVLQKVFEHGGFPVR